MIENIQQLYSEVHNKTEFIKKVAIELGKKPNTLKNHWFSGFFSIPDEHQQTVLNLLKQTIEEQPEVAK